MDFITIVLAATIPALVVAGVAYLLIDKMLKAENARRSFEIRKEMMKTLTPVKLHAYERMAIFIERISPDSLLNRQNLSDASALNLQKSLLQDIRTEWEHNLSQQLYLSNDSWIMLRNAKESMIQLINTCAAQATMNSSSLDYAKLILETFQTVEKTPLDTALSMLKADLNKLS